MLAYLFDFFLVSGGKPVLLWTFSLTLPLQRPIVLGLLCFHFYSFLVVLEGMMLNLKLQYFGHLMRRVDSDAGRDWRQEEKEKTGDEMAGWHHQFDGCEFDWTPGDGDGQRGLAFCDSWGHKQSVTTEWLNWTELNAYFDFPSLLFLWIFGYSAACCSASICWNFNRFSPGIDI